jgi:hypothetical protein
MATTTKLAKPLMPGIPTQPSTMMEKLAAAASTIQVN